MDPYEKDRYEYEHRYDDLFTPEWDRITAELQGLEKARTPTPAAKRRILMLRRGLAALLAPVPCRCDCFGDFDCTCRRCSALASNNGRIWRLERRPSRAKAPPAPAPAPKPIPLPQGPPATGRSNAALAAKLYLMTGLDGEDLNTWIVNETAEDLVYQVRTGEFGPGASPFPIVRGPKTVPARSAVIFDSDVWYGADYSVWWEVFVVRKDGRVHHMRASRRVNLYDGQKYDEPIPYTNKRGAISRLEWTKRARSIPA